MPQVPQYQQRIEQRALPDARVPVDAPDAAFGGGMARAGAEAAGNMRSAGMDIYVRERDRADDTAVEQAANLATVARNNLLMGDGGALAQKGQNAFGVVNAYGKKYESELKKIEDGLAGPRQKAMFRQVRDKQQTEMSGSLQRHLFSESERFRADTFKNSLAVSRDDAAKNFMQPGKVAEEVKRQRELVAKFAATEGVDADTARLWTEGAVSGTHASVIERMLAIDQDLAADAYYKANKKEITGADQVNLDKALEAGGLRGKSQRTSDDIMRRYDTRQAALDAVAEIKDPKVRDEVERRVENNWSRRDREAEHAAGTLFMESIGVLEQGGSIDQLGIRYDRLSPKYQKTLKVLEGQMNGTIEPRVNVDTYAKYQLMNPYQLAKVSEYELIADARPGLDRATWGNLKQRWSDARAAATGGGESKMAGKVKSMMTDEELVMSAMAAGGIGGVKRGDMGKEILKDGKKREAYAMFRQAVDDAIGTEEYKTGRPLGADEKKAVIGRLTRDTVFVPRVGDDKEIPRALVSESDKGKEYIPFDRIPAPAVSQFIGLARSQGILAPGKTDDQARVILKSRMERAWAAAARGAGTSEILNLLSKD